MTTEYMFTPEQQRILNQIEELRQAAAKPFEERLAELQQDILWVARTHYNEEAYRQSDYGKQPLLLFQEFNAWDWCYEWQKERYVKAWSDLCASNMRFATLAAKIYAMVPVTIRIPIGEFLNSPVFKENHDKP